MAPVETAVAAMAADHHAVVVAEDLALAAVLVRFPEPEVLLEVAVAPVAVVPAAQRVVVHRSEREVVVAATAKSCSR